MLLKWIDGLTPKHLFLIDGLGALITASLLAFVLAPFEGFFGMPRNIVLVLAGIAGLFAVYSLSCYLRLPVRWPLFLRGIALANLSYCVLTLALVFLLWEVLTVWGVLYFLGEVIVVFSLVWVEWRRSAMG